MKERADSEKVSPTAFATGYFWYRNGLSHEGLVTPEGRKLDRRFGYLIRLIKLISGTSIEALLLARHRGIDALLARHIESGKVTQVIELAAGLSARGWRFTQKYGDRITYVETDLPHMAELKRAMLERAGLTSSKHRVVPVNVLLDRGPGSLHDVAQPLVPAGGLAIITEGLMSYLDPRTASGVWRRIARTLGTFGFGVYLSEGYVRNNRRDIGGALFRGVIQQFVRGRLHVHFETPEQALVQMKKAGFRTVTLHEPRQIPETRELGAVRGGDRVRVLEALV